MPVTITLPPLLIGLYSREAAELIGTVVYQGLDGKWHRVTCVCPSEESVSRYMWPDAIRVGYMTRYICRC